MKHALIAIAATLTTLHCSAAAVRSFDLPDAGKPLVLHLSDGRSLEAPLTSPEQEGFSDVHIAPNKRLVGWTATFPNCCTSYPLPRSLVVHDGVRVVRVIGEEDLSIFDWKFSNDSQSIIFHRQLPHGNSLQQFRWIRIADGKLLGEFDCLPIEPGQPSRGVAHPPKWTNAQDLECHPPRGGKGQGVKP